MRRGRKFGRAEKLTALDRADVRFIRPNVQIYDAHVADLYQWVCAQYLVGVKGAETVCWRSLGESNPCFSLERAPEQNGTKLDSFQKR